MATLQFRRTEGDFKNPLEVAPFFLRCIRRWNIRLSGYLEIIEGQARGQQYLTGLDDHSMVDRVGEQTNW